MKGCCNTWKEMLSASWVASFFIGELVDQEYTKTKCLKFSLYNEQVRPQIAFLNHGMLVRHIIDEKSPLHCQSPESLHRDDTIFILSMVSFLTCHYKLWHSSLFSTTLPCFKKGCNVDHLMAVSGTDLKIKPYTTFR